MRSQSIEEMPFDHSIEYDLNQELLLEEYCNWDIQETLRLFKHSLDFIDLRFQIKKDSKINCINYNNGKIGMELLLSKYCSKTGLSKEDVKHLEKEVSYQIPLKNLIFPYIHFKSKAFQSVLKKFESIVWTPKDDDDETKKEKGLFTLSYKQSVNHDKKKNYGYIYGYGGLHQCIKPGVYEDDEDHIIIDADVASLYPSIPISYYSWLLDKPIKYQNEQLKQVDSPVIYPPQLGIEVLQVYKEEIVDVRLAEKEKPKDHQNKTIISGYKEAANIPYGKSGEHTSWFYSKRYNLTTTINGQLLISMLSERLYDLKDCIMLQNNTKMPNWC